MEDKDFDKVALEILGRMHTLAKSREVVFHVAFSDTNLPSSKLDISEITFAFTKLLEMFIRCSTKGSKVKVKIYSTKKSFKHLSILEEYLVLSVEKRPSFLDWDFIDVKSLEQLEFCENTIDLGDTQREAVWKNLYEILEKNSGDILIENIESTGCRISLLFPI